MLNTENYELKKYEGSDIFNPLVVENENMELIDQYMKDNADATVGDATHLKSGNIHAILRTNPDAAMFRFTATEDYEVGDSFTIDGLSVTAKMVNGEGLPERAFVVNSTVLCSLVGQLLTVYVGSTKDAENAKKLDGHEAEYFATKAEVDDAKSVAEAAGNLATSNLELIGTHGTLWGTSWNGSVASTVRTLGSLKLPRGLYIFNFDVRGSNQNISVGVSEGTIPSDPYPYGGYSAGLGSFALANAPKNIARQVTRIIPLSKETTLNLWAAKPNSIGSENVVINLYIIGFPFVQSTNPKVS